MFEKVRLVNKMRIRMKRRKISTRLFQIVVVTVVLTLFMYLLFQAGFSRPPPPAKDFSWLSTRNMSHFLKPLEETALAQPSPCQGENTKLLVAVFTAPTNFDARSSIRKTWGKKFAAGQNARVIFMLGRTEASEIYNRITREVEDYNDLVIEDFHDTYLNLTLKTTFMLKWVHKNCPKAKFVFKIDDDVFVNTEKLWAALESSHLYFKNLQLRNLAGEEERTSVDYTLIGHLINTVPDRDPTSKWYLPPSFYPLNIFPKFLRGIGYIFSGSLVPALYYCSLKTPFINLEDVFLTGLCATTQLGLRLTHNPDFQWRPMEIGGSHTCNYKQSVIVHGPFQPAELEEIYEKTQDDLLCDTLLFYLMSYASSAIAFFRNIFRI